MSNKTLNYGDAYTIFMRSDATGSDELAIVKSVVSYLVIAQYLNVALMTVLVYHTRSYYNFLSCMDLLQELTYTTFQVITTDKQVC